MKRPNGFQRYWNQKVASQGVLPKIEIGSQPTLSPNSITIIMRQRVAPANSVRDQQAEFKDVDDRSRR